ncbi:aspartyl protease [Ceratobasidium sp. AG-Ba]|nr:aspartyl protease [Ceratobasidium sp. AG-Ba]QRW08647.1 aspartyl protease [Ceratobasidium sp. AG-Ba]
MYLVTLLGVALATTGVVAAEAESRGARSVVIDTLPITSNFKLPDDGLTLPQRDRARIRALFARSRGEVHVSKREDVSAKNTAIHYTMKVGVGSPPTFWIRDADDLLLDSGSGYTWLGAGQKFVKTKTAHKQKQGFYAAYASGSAVGDNYKDLVTLSPTLSISNKSIGIATSTNAISGFDGILGLGPAALSNVLTPSTGKPVPTIMDALFAQKKIAQNVFGLSFAPTKSQGEMNGVITFGGTNSGKYTGTLNWVDVTKQESFSSFWGYEQSIKYGNKTLQKTAAGVVDTGTTLVYITPKAFKVYSDSLPGSKTDDKTGLLEIPKESVGKMKSLFYIINGVSYEFTPNAQLWPRALNTALGGKADAYYSVVGALSDFEADSGSSFINGYVFLERFYTAYDQSKRRIGFATTPATYSNVN